MINSLCLFFQEAVLKLVQAQEPFYQALKALDSYVVESQMLEFEVQAAKAHVSQAKRLCKAEQEALEKAQVFSQHNLQCGFSHLILSNTPVYLYF